MMVLLTMNENDNEDDADANIGNDDDDGGGKWQVKERRGDWRVGLELSQGVMMYLEGVG